MRFTELELSESLQRGAQGLGYQSATPIQAQAIPPALAGRDVVGCAQTGTGKTAAFVLPALEHLLRNPAKTQNPRVLILTPTRELCIQVAQEASELAKHASLRVTAVYGGAKMQRQTDRLRRGTDVVVATPGRLMDHMRRRNVRLSEVQLLVLDEADLMLDMGFLPDIEHIINRTPQERQTMLFSATMPPQISALARQFQRAPVRIDIDTARPPESIQQALYPVPKHLKVPLLMAILRTMDVHSMLVFTRTKREADIVTRQLDESGISVACIHGDFRQKARIAALEGFRSGKHHVLVATNVAARGLDVEGISHVINYDVPDEAENYVHRIGRTARLDAEGDAITLVTPDDEKLVQHIEYLLGFKIERKKLPNFDYDVPVPSWARPSPDTLRKGSSQGKSLADRWRNML
jgi:ATP-dependent RNA helicase RhlE